jgi:hypothetical protein
VHLFFEMANHVKESHKREPSDFDGWSTL